MQRSHNLFTTEQILISEKLVVYKHIDYNTNFVDYLLPTDLMY